MKEIPTAEEFLKKFREDNYRTLHTKDYDTAPMKAYATMIVESLDKQTERELGVATIERSIGFNIARETMIKRIK